MFSQRQVLVQRSFVRNEHEPGAGVGAGWPEPVNVNLAVAGQQIDQGTQQGAFACTVGPGQQGQFAGKQTEIGMADYGSPAQLDGELLDNQWLFIGRHRAEAYQKTLT